MRWRSEGRSATEILNFYFPGAVAGITPAGDGWQRVTGAGWTLLTTAPAGGLIGEGNAAWARAQSLFGSAAGSTVPTVQELPQHGALSPNHGRARLGAGRDPREQRVLAAGHGAAKQRGEAKPCFSMSFCMSWWSSTQAHKLRCGYGKVWLRLWLTRVSRNSGLPCRKGSWMLPWLAPPTPPPRERPHQVAARMAAELSIRYGMAAGERLFAQRSATERAQEPAIVCGCLCSSQRRCWFFIRSSAMIARKNRFSCTSSCPSDRGTIASIRSTYMGPKVVCLTLRVPYHGGLPHTSLRLPTS